MGTEIERKFLVTDETWRRHAQPGQAMRQGYLYVGPPTAIRVRTAGDRAWLNIKKATLAVTRAEFEYPIPLEDAQAILDHLCEGYIIEKTRYKIEIDEFHGVNGGLIVAEVELDHEDQPFKKPSWVGEEVSGDPRYLNSHLSRRPYSQWDEF